MRPKISILITIYEEDVTSLVRHLTNHAERCRVNIEVLCADDHSSHIIRSANRPLAHLDDVRYMEMPQNMGRAALRNRLAEEAEYDHLLFLDGDTLPVDENFICNYLPFCSENMVVYGGRKYHDQRPEDDARVLHWYYGRQREALSVAKRRKHPYRSFHSNNFLIHRSLFQRITFDNNIEGYGHEDSLFAHELKQKGIPVIHADNPAFHHGIEKAEDFLRKHRQAIRNLLELRRKGIEIPSRLMSLYHKLSYVGGKMWIPLFFKCLDKESFTVAAPQLPSLRKFDALRLYWLYEDQNMLSEEIEHTPQYQKKPN